MLPSRLWTNKLVKRLLVIRCFNPVGIARLRLILYLMYFTFRSYENGFSLGGSNLREFSHTTGKRSLEKCELSPLADSALPQWECFLMIVEFSHHREHF